MDFLQLFLILLILVLTIFLGLGGYMVFLILKDLRADLSKLDIILSSDPVVLDKVKKDVKRAEVKREKSEKIFSSPRKFFKRS